jgi:hypothetical protein
MSPSEDLYAVVTIALVLIYGFCTFLRRSALFTLILLIFLPRLVAVFTPALYGHSGVSNRSGYGRMGIASYLCLDHWWPDRMTLVLKGFSSFFSIVFHLQYLHKFIPRRNFSPPLQVMEYWGVLGLRWTRLF